MEIYSPKKDIGDYKFALGLPQGLPQSYFLANLFMVEVEKKYKEIIPGEMFFYVDDSVIFTKEIKDVDDLKSKIEILNVLISAWMDELYHKNVGCLSQDYILSVEKIYELFHIKIHELDDKSSISDIGESKQGEIYLHCIGRETSKTAFDINTSFSDEESKILLNKTKCIFMAVDKELKKIEKELKEDVPNKTSDREYKESYKKKLIRYKKFFKYRSQYLEYREEPDAIALCKQILTDLKFMDDVGDRKKALLCFFERYNEDTLGAAISFVLRSLKELGEDDSVLVDKIVALNQLLFDGDNKETSYLYASYKEYIEKNECELPEITEYATLKRVAKEKYGFLKKTIDKKKTEHVIDVIEEKDPRYPAKKMMDAGLYDMADIVLNNSYDIQRRCLNSILSGILQIDISDDVALQKYGNRNITYSELRMLVYLRNRHFTFEEFEIIRNDFFKDKYQYAIDYSIMQVLSIFKTFVSVPGYIDNLILVHKYVCDVWKNGSKHLYFYTLHNQEHAVDLIQNSLKIIRAIDYIDISKNDYYVLFIACYLHDISMVTLPDLNLILEDTFDCNKIYTDFIRDIHEIWKNNHMAQRAVKAMLKEYYMKLDEFYEKKVRDNHAKNSASEIRERNDLGFIDDSVREIAAEVSEAHCYNVSEVYKVKSNAGTSLWNRKFVEIILRLADLLDMSSYRVSALVLNHNLDNMGAVSGFHWMSHLVTTGYEIETDYYLEDEQKADSYLERHGMVEKITLRVDVNLPQLTHESLKECKNMCLKSIDHTTLCLECGKTCDNEEECNFLCKWFTEKNYYLFQELEALQEYLEALQDNYFKPRIEVVVKSSEKNGLSTEQFTLLKKYMDKR